MSKKRQEQVPGGAAAALQEVGGGDPISQEELPCVAWNAHLSGIAARAHDRAAVKLGRPRALTNFPDEYENWRNGAEDDFLGFKGEEGVEKGETGEEDEVGFMGGSEAEGGEGRRKAGMDMNGE
ncbi:unnamed protein product, partial [Closterium sp. NIES-53]